MPSMSCPPILFLIFNRPDLTSQVFGAIRQARPAKLFIAADGPRRNREHEAALCQETRQFVENRIDWPCEVKKLFRDRNLGCKLAVSSAVTWFFEHVEQGIILEDDCLPCSDFFTFCGSMLAYHKDTANVTHIGGANFQRGKSRGGGSYYYSRLVHVWGWASWRRAWQAYDVDIRSWPCLREKDWSSEFKMDRRERDYWTDIFDRVYRGEIDTWDYQWAFACWQQRSLSVIPNVNLITNIGFRPDATHTVVPNNDSSLSTGTLEQIVHTKAIIADRKADRFTFNRHFFQPERQISVLATRFGRKLRRVFRERIFGVRKTQQTEG